MDKMHQLDVNHIEKPVHKRRPSFLQILHGNGRCGYTEKFMLSKNVWKRKVLHKLKIIGIQNMNGLSDKYNCFCI